MHKADIVLDRTQYNLFAMVAAGNMDFSEGLKKLQVLGACKGKPGETVQQLTFSVEELPTTEGIAWVQHYKVNLEGLNPVFLDLDTQRGVLKNPAMAEHADVILTIGVETENLNRLPLH